jgi:hypothetical protein
MSRPDFDVAMLPGQPKEPIEIDQVRRLVSDITDLAAAHYGQVIVAFAKAFMALSAVARTCGADPAEAFQDIALRTATEDGEGLDGSSPTSPPRRLPVMAFAKTSKRPMHRRLNGAEHVATE